MIEVIKKVVRARKLGPFKMCDIDTLIRIDEKKCFIDCKNCTVRDIEANLSLCPHRYLLAQEVL